MKIKIALVTFVLSGTLSAEPLCLQKEFEVQLTPPGTPLASNVERQPRAAIQLLKEMFRRGGPQLGCLWVESCYLLTLGDLRTRGAWNGFLKPTGPADLEAVDALNTWLVPRGISLHFSSSERGNEIDVVSLSGLEYTSHLSQQDWVIPYDRATGWAGYYDWRRKCRQRSEALGSMRFHLMEGFLLGYPDSAVVGYVDPRGQHDFFTVQSSVPDIDYFKCGLPIFSLPARSAAQADVVKTETEWQDFLHGVYSNPEFQTWIHSPEFAQARDQRLQAIEDKDRLGQGAPRINELSTQQQRWLVANPEAFAVVLIGSRNLSEALARLQAARPDLHWSWSALTRLLMRSAVDAKDPAGALLVLAKTWVNQDSWLSILENQFRMASRDLPRQQISLGKLDEWQMPLNNYLDLLTIPELVTLVQSRLDADKARLFFEDLWLLRHYPQAADWVARIQSGQLFQERQIELRRTWVPTEAGGPKL